MGRQIPQAFIDDLLTRTDIVELIDSRYPLRKAGNEYIACCPFHNEKTPSFTVSPQKQFYHCFGCSAHGTALGFLIEFDHLNFIEAVEELARRAGMALPQSEDEVCSDDHRKLYEILTQAAGFYRQQLEACADQKGVKAYLQQRGLSRSIVAEFELGFAPSRWDALLHYIQPPFRTQLQTAGLVIDKGDGRCYDRFRDRLIFPIHDYRGRIIGFGGRLLGEGSPKYLNSPETPLFHKGRELYGLYQVRKSLRTCERLLVVEGYMDVLALAEHQIRYAVATLGTATTSDHLMRLFRVAPVVVFCFDGDRAGSQAAGRALETLLPLLSQGRQAQFMFLPQGEDPDTLVRAEGQVVFESRIEKAMPLSDYLLHRLQQRIDLGSVDGRARLVERARPLVSRIPPGIYRDMLLSRLAKAAQVEQPTLNRYFAQEKTPAAMPRQRLDLNMISLRQRAIAILLQRPGLIQSVSSGLFLQEMDGAEINLLREIIELLQANPHLNTAAVLERWRNSKTGRYLERLASLEFPLTDKDMALELEKALHCIQSQAADQRLAVLADKPLEHLTDAERQELRALLTARISGDVFVVQGNP